MNELWNNLRTFTLWWTIIPISIIFYFLPEIIAFIDPTGAVVHQDFWQFVLMAICIVMIFSDFAFGFIAINLPAYFKWYVKHFSEGSEHAPWLLFAYFSIIMLCFVLTLTALV